MINAPFFEKVFKAFKVDEMSDINEHLETLREYADNSKSILELGHCSGRSTVAFMVSTAEIVHSVDIQHCESWEDLDVFVVLYKDQGCPEFKHFQADSLTWEPVLPDYDLIFIDDLHDGKHLETELHKYSLLANNAIILHDTDSVHYSWKGETAPEGVRWGLMNWLLTPSGLKWYISRHYPNNNGLTVLERR